MPQEGGDLPVRVTLAEQRVEQPPGPPAGNSLPVGEHRGGAQYPRLRVRPNLRHPAGSDLQDQRFAHAGERGGLSIPDALVLELLEVRAGGRRVDQLGGVRKPGVSYSGLAEASIRVVRDAAGEAAAALPESSNIAVRPFEGARHCRMPLSKSGHPSWTK